MQSNVRNSKLAALDNPSFDRLQATPAKKTPPYGPREEETSDPTKGVRADPQENVRIQMNEHSERNKRQDAVTNRENIDTDVSTQVQKKPKGDNLKAAKAQPMEAISRTPVAGLFDLFL